MDGICNTVQETVTKTITKKKKYKKAKWLSEEPLQTAEERSESQGTKGKIYPTECIVHLRRLSHLFLLFSGTLHSVGYIFPFVPWLSLLSSAVCKGSSDNHFAFLYFFFLRMVLFTSSCTMLSTSVHSSSGTLSTVIYNSTI